MEGKDIEEEQTDDNNYLGKVNYVSLALIQRILFRHILRTLHNKNPVLIIYTVY